MWGNQSLISMPLCPCLRKPTWSGKRVLRWLPLASGTTSRSRASFFGSCTEANGVSAMVLPAYFVSMGFGSKLSMWLTPPFMKSQITFLAFGVKCGRPSGGVHRAELAAPASRWRSLPRASPVKPMPRSARKARRGCSGVCPWAGSSECEAPTEGAEVMVGMDGVYGLGFIGASQNHHG